MADLGEESPVAFRDVAEVLGVAKRDRGRGNAWGDFDGDGDLDLFSIGIQVPHSLYRNESGAQFTDVTAAAGLGDPRGGWSATAVDYDNVGDLDLYATRDAWEGKAPNSLYRNLGGLRFGEVGGEAGVGDPDDSFTAAWGDVDNDGRVDLYVAEGITGGGTRNKLFVNLGGRFENRRDRLGVAHPGKSLGVAFADYDGDGDLDLYAAIGGHYPGDLWPNSLYRNSGRGSHWLAVELEGTQSNRSAIGAQVTVHAGGRQPY